jgi:hypothetical protein
VGEKRWECEAQASREAARAWGCAGRGGEGDCNRIRTRPYLAAALGHGSNVVSLPVEAFGAIFAYSRHLRSCSDKQQA